MTVRATRETAPGAVAAEPDQSPPVAIFAGTANPPLAAAIAREVGVELGACVVERFPDGEVAVHIDESVRGRDVFLIQPTSPPVNDHLVELLVLADACRRADARRLTAIVPYFGYSRSDKREGRRAPVTARTVADLMQAVGIDHVVTVDAHTPQLEGFFRIPIDNLSAVPVFCEALRPQLSEDTVVVSPDLGGVKRATDLGDRLGRPVAVCVKRRASGSQVSVSQVIGEVRDRPCLIVDDMITTGGTIVECVKALRAHGAREGCEVVASHAVLVDGAREKLRAAGVRNILTSDSIPGEDGGEPPIERVSIAPMLAKVVMRLATAQSLGSVY